MLENISYCTYNFLISKANDQEVLFTILDKVPLDELNSFVNGFMQHLLLQKNLNGDTIISEYIQVCYFISFIFL